MKNIQMGSKIKKILQIATPIFIGLLFFVANQASAVDASKNNCDGWLQMDILDYKGKSLIENGNLDIAYGNRNNLTFVVTKATGTDVTKHYSYQVLAIDDQTSKETTIFSNNMSFDTEQTKKNTVKINTIGKVRLQLRYLDTSGTRYGDTGCNWTDGKYAYFILSDNGTSSPNISMSVDRATIAQGDTANISFSIKYSGDFLYYRIFINKGGDECPYTKETEACWIEKNGWGDVLPSSSENNGIFTGVYPWVTTNYTNPGIHKIKLKVFEMNPATEVITFVDGQATNITVCDKNAPTGSCVPETPPADELDPGSGDDPSQITINNEKVKKATESVKTLGGLINKILLVLQIVIGALSFIGIMIGGILYITSNGDTAKADKAKKTLIYSVIGMVLAIFSYVIFRLIVTTIS